MYKISMQKAMLTDPAKIAALAAEMVPGAKVPEGLEAMSGIDLFEVKMVTFGPSNVMRVEGGDAKVSDVRFIFITLFSGGENREDEREVESLGVEKTVVGGVELEFEKSRSFQFGVETLHYETELPIRGGRIVQLKIFGPKDRFDHGAMTEFLAGIESLAPPPAEAPAKTGQPTKDKK